MSSRESKAVVVMGVAGSGKSTVGQALALKLGWTFIDADDYHPPENIARMASGIPLTEDDRDPWLSTLRELISAYSNEGRGIVLACSALKQRHRDILGGCNTPLTFVYLKGTYATLYQRLSVRKNHFMKADMLKSQFECLEEPANALVFDVDHPPLGIVDKVVDLLTTSNANLAS